MQEKACFLMHDLGNQLYPLVYNAAFPAVGLNAQYSVQDIKPKKLAKFMDRVRQKEFFGVSVGYPFQEEVLNFVNHTTEEARVIGTINTLYFDKGILLGDNTDWFGLKVVLDEHDFRDKTALVYGAGSAARAALFALQDCGLSQLYIANRNTEKAQFLANEFGALVCDPLDLPQVEVLINATRVGENDKNFLLFKEDFLQKCELILDMVPNETLLIKTAKELGVDFVAGKAILLFQLTRQFELFTGLEAPVAEMATVLGFKI